MSGQPNGPPGRLGFPQASGPASYQHVPQFNQFGAVPPQQQTAYGTHGSAPSLPTGLQQQYQPYPPSAQINGHPSMGMPLPPAGISAPAGSAFKPYSDVKNSPYPSPSPHPLPAMPPLPSASTYPPPPSLPSVPLLPKPQMPLPSPAQINQQFGQMKMGAPAPLGPHPPAVASIPPPGGLGFPPEPAHLPPGPPQTSHFPPPQSQPSHLPPGPPLQPSYRPPGPPQPSQLPQPSHFPPPAHHQPQPQPPPFYSHPPSFPSSTTAPPSYSGPPQSSAAPPPAGYYQQPHASSGYPSQQQSACAGGYGSGPAGQNRSLSDFIDLAAERNPLHYGVGEVEYSLPQSVGNTDVRCDPAIFRCTLNAVPQTEELLAKSRLPLGLTLQPFRDVKQLNVIRTPTIVRCRYCRTYINPFVRADNRRWKCNLCFKDNDFPEDFLYDPVTRGYQEASRRPELQHATVEFIAPNEYMLRSPQPAVYIFLLDVSAAAIHSGYLPTFCEQMLINVNQMPGDERTLIAFIAVDSSIHFFHFYNETRIPREMVVDDVDEVFLPMNTGLLVNLKTFKESVRLLLSRLPEMYSSPSTASTSNCLGAALNAAKELIGETGGRVSVFQCSLPNIGPGALKSREDPNERAGKDAEVSPATDFYKRLSLECTAVQIGIDLFAFNREFIDIATLSEMAKFSSGSVYRFPNFDLMEEPRERRRFEKTFTRYLTRKIGFEAVLRIRCSRGLAVSAFYGNFFVRSTDLLSMANVNPDSAVGVQLSYEEKICTATVCFQAALLYTSSKGDRRIRVHTLCLPTTSELSALFASVDCRAMVSLLAKLGGERAMAGSSLSDCREAIVNASIDGLGAFAKTAGRMGVLAPRGGHLKLLPLMSLSLLKHAAFAAGRSIKVDDRVTAMLALRSYPIEYICSDVYPLLFRLNDIPAKPESSEAQQLPLSWEHVSREGVYLLVAGYSLLVYVAASSDPLFVSNLFGLKYQQLDSESWKEQPNDVSQKVHSFVNTLSHRLHILGSPEVIREDSPLRILFVSRFMDDRTESTHSYVEFIQHIKKEIGH